MTVSVHSFRSAALKLESTRLAAHIAMTDQARLAYTAHRPTRHASGSSISRSVQGGPTAQPVRRDQQVADVLAQLGRLAICDAYPPGRMLAESRLDIDIDRACVVTIHDADSPDRHEGSPGGASTLVRLLVTVRIPEGEGDQTTALRNGRLGNPSATGALLDALEHLTAGQPPLVEAQSSIFHRPAPGTLPPMCLAKVKRYIEQHLAERVQLADLAAITRLSVSRFISAFRCSTGIPPYRYLVQRRVAAAAALIRETNRPLTDIAQETGFSDQSHLCRSFAQVLRMTPGNYRRMYR